MQAYNKYKRLISRLICLCVGSAVLHEDFFFYVYKGFMCIKYMQIHSEIYVNSTSRTNGAVHNSSK